MSYDGGDVHSEPGSTRKKILPPTERNARLKSQEVLSYWCAATIQPRLQSSFVERDLMQGSTISEMMTRSGLE